MALPKIELELLDKNGKLIKVFDATFQVAEQARWSLYRMQKSIRDRTTIELPNLYQLMPDPELDILYRNGEVHFNDSHLNEKIIQWLSMVGTDSSDIQDVYQHLCHINRLESDQKERRDTLEKIKNPETKVLTGPDRFTNVNFIQCDELKSDDGFFSIDDADTPRQLEEEGILVVNSTTPVVYALDMDDIDILLEDVECNIVPDHPDISDKKGFMACEDAINEIIENRMSDHYEDASDSLVDVPAFSEGMYQIIKDAVANQTFQIEKMSPETKEKIAELLKTYNDAQTIISYTVDDNTFIAVPEHFTREDCIRYMEDLIEQKSRNLENERENGWFQKNITPAFNPGC